jgi:integrase
VYLFHQGAERYLEERTHLASFEDVKAAALRLLSFLGEMPLADIHDGTLKPYIDWRKQQGAKTRKRDPKTGDLVVYRRELKHSSINRELEVVRTILVSAWRRWRCEWTGQPWIDSAPIITMLPTKPRKGDPEAAHSAKPYPLSWAEQDALFAELAPRLQRMCLFKVNTGTREQEVCQLRWDWEHEVPELNTSVFIVPEGYVKNGEARLIVLNRIALSVIEQSLHSSSWKRAWKEAGLPTGPHVRQGVHNLKHTCGRRLRAAGVPLETRKVCLGHTTGDITTHYSAAEVQEVLSAFEKLCDRREGIVIRPKLTVIGG